MIYAVGSPLPLPEGPDRWTAAASLLRILQKSQRHWVAKSFGTSMLVIVVISACVTLLRHEHAKDFESLQDYGESSAFDQDHHKNLR